MPEWLSPKLAYQIPLWLLSRPQQAIFQGAEEGAGEYERATARYQNQGYDPVTANLAGLGQSAYKGIQGAAKAFNPWGEDVSGSDLTKDFTGGQTLDKGIGFLLDLLADPLNAPLGAAGKVVGTMRRTVPNLMKIRGAANAEKAASRYRLPDEALAWLDQPAVAETGDSIFDPAKKILDWLTVAPSESRTGRTARNLASIEGGREATWDTLNNLGWKKWLLDVPAAPRDALEPLVIRNQGPVTDLGMRLYPNNTDFFQRIKDSGRQANGFYTARDKVMPFNTQTQATTLPHEMVHWARDTTPDPFQLPTRQDLMDLPRFFPIMAEKLRKSPAYANKSRWSLGEEIAARKIPQGIEFESALLRRLKDRAYGGIQPEMYTDANRIPLEMLYGVSKMNERY